MRFIIAYYMMLIYVTVVIRPLIPFVRDAWGHQFNEIEHISLVHAKYGSNHLEKELAGAENDSSSGNQKSPKPAEASDIHMPGEIYCYVFSFENKNPKFYILVIPKLPFKFFSIIAPPPELFC